MRIVFAGTPEVSVPTLEACLDAGHDVVLVVTQPDRPSGRGRHILPSPVKAFAVERGLPVLQPTGINAPETLALVRRLQPDAIVVSAFGQKLSPALLATPRRGCFNVHASLLPRFRGPAPINWAIVTGEEETGVTIIRMVERMDAGDILARQAVRIDDDWTAGDLAEVLGRMGAKRMVRVLSELEAGTAHPLPQDPSNVSRAPMLKKSDGLIPWTKSARQVHNHVRGMTPWPGAFTFLPRVGAPHPLRITVLRAVVEPPADASAGPGAVVALVRRGIAVACGEGVLLLAEVKPAGGHAMPADDFARGHRITPGLRFTDDETLDE
jgi:methionyl-tRNA formyltransferase